MEVMLWAASDRSALGGLGWSVFATVALVIVGGCQAPAIQRRTIEDLVQESLAASKNTGRGFGEDSSSAGPVLRQGRDANQNGDSLATDLPPSAPSAIKLVQAQEETEADAGDDEEQEELLVNEIFEETDVRQAIQSIASQAGVSVILDDRIAGTATAVIEDEPFEQALKKLLLPLGYVYRRQEGQFLIGVADPESSLFPLLADRFHFSPQHLSKDELKEMLPDRLSKFARAAGKNNLIVIEAPRDVGKRILAELERLDQPSPQVVLEAIVCVFNPESSFRWGLDLQQTFRTAQDEIMRLELTGLAFSGRVSPATMDQLFGDFGVTSHFLRLLAQEGYVEIRAAPRVMAKSGEKATIAMERETFFSTSPVSSQFLVRQDIQKVDAGISMEIVSHIRGDNVTVVIEKAEVSEDIRENATNASLANPFPLINRRRVSTTVHVKDGQTIVLGGLVQRQTVDRVSKVPLLGDLPGLGYLFKQIDQQQEDVEVAIFLSPRIVREASPSLETEYRPSSLPSPFSAPTEDSPLDAPLNHAPLNHAPQQIYETKKISAGPVPAHARHGHLRSNNAGLGEAAQAFRIDPPTVSASTGVPHFPHRAAAGSVARPKAAFPLQTRNQR